LCAQLTRDLFAIAKLNLTALVYNDLKQKIQLLLTNYMTEHTFNAIITLVLCLCTCYT